MTDLASSFQYKRFDDLSAEEKREGSSLKFDQLAGKVNYSSPRPVFIKEEWVMICMIWEDGERYLMNASNG